MRNCKWRGSIAALLGYFGSLSPTLAQGIFYAPDHQPSAWNVNQKPAVWDINLAAGAAMEPTFHGSDRYRATPIPLVIIRWRDTVSLGDDGLNIYWHNSNLRIGGGVSYDGGRLDHETSGILSSGDGRLKGLGDVDASVGLRGFVSYMMGPVYLDTSAIKYVGPQNKGIVVTLGASAPLSLTDRFILRPHAGVTWADDNYMQTFFGITPLQASQSIFPQFNAGAGLEDVNAGLTAVYLLSHHWFLGADASATQFLDHAARSPITISNTNATVAAVVGYHF
jgi:outer membrane scaffolding protein for murein synthesis (MipA/OmpV family)